MTGYITIKVYIWYKAVTSDQSSIHSVNNTLATSMS